NGGSDTKKATAGGATSAAKNESGTESATENENIDFSPERSDNETGNTDDAAPLSESTTSTTDATHGPIKSDNEENNKTDTEEDTRTDTGQQDLEQMEIYEPSFDSTKWKALVVCGLAGCFIVNFILPSMRFRYMQPFVPMIIVLSLTSADMIFRNKPDL